MHQDLFVNDCSVPEFPLQGKTKFFAGSTVIIRVEYVAL